LKWQYYEGVEKLDKEGLGFVNFQIRPHFNSPSFPKVRTKYLEKLAKKIPEPIYAIDDKTAIKVLDREVLVVSEGEWKRFN
jgi:dipeptidase E